MNNIALIEKTGFHDAALVGLAAAGGKAQLFFQNVWTSDDEVYMVVVVIDGVKDIKRNEEPVDCLSMEGDHANVIEFSWADDVAVLLVEWRSSSPPSGRICSYTFGFGTFEIQAGRQNRTTQRSSGRLQWD